MKKSLLMMLSLLLLLPAVLIAGGAEETIVDVETTDAAATFEGILDLDRTDGWALGRKGGRLVWASLSDPKSFNGVVAAETSTTDITDALESSLARRNQFTLGWEPDLAESWSISADEKTVTYRLRPNLRWSDGERLTARDFVFTANHLLLREDVGSNSRSAQLQTNPDGGPDIPIVWKYISDRTLSATFPQVTAGIITQSAIEPYPMHVYQHVIGWTEADGLDYEYEFGTDENGDEILVELKPDGVDYSAVTSFQGVDTNVSVIVSSGPWLVKEYVPSQKVVLEPNPFYWEQDDAGVQLPYLDELVYVMIPDQDSQLQAFIAGQTDTYTVRGEDYAVLVDRQEELGFSIWSVGAVFSTQFITFNQNPIEGEDDAGLGEPEITWLSNRTFRQAMASLVDRRPLSTMLRLDSDILRSASFRG